MVLELAALRHYAVKHRIGSPLSIVRTASGALMERGVVNPEKVISHRFPLHEIGKAMEVMGTPGRNKVVINP